jgi:uncharacterized membrane protein YdjX (TVP38/TMEM64 family)
VTLIPFATVALLAVLYFTVPWVPILEEVLYLVDELGIRGIFLLFVLHQIAMLSVFGPLVLLEYGWIFLRGWIAVPVIVLSYVLGIAIMLLVGQRLLRQCILRRVQGNRLMQATQRVLDRHPYGWYVAFQFWGVVPWRVSVYCAHVLAPHAYLAGMGFATLIGQLPDLLYRAFLATKIKDLDSLVTGRLETRLDTAIFWVSVIVTTLISLVLYMKIRAAFLIAAGLGDSETQDGSETESSNESHGEEEPTTQRAITIHQDGV